MIYKSSFIILILFINCLFAQADKTLTLKEVIEQTLDNNPNIKISKSSLDASLGRYINSGNEFDPTLNLNVSFDKSEDPLSFGVDVILPTRKTINYNLSLQKKFNWGLLVQPNFTVLQSDNTLVNTNELATQSRIGLKLVYPLLRNRGIIGTGANEISNQINFEADKIEQTFTIATEIKNVINAYLDLLNSQLSLNIYKDSESRAKQIVELTKLLINADKRPSSELKIVEGNYADKLVTKIRSQNQLVSSIKNLSLVIGKDYNFDEEVFVDTNYYSNNLENIIIDNSVLENTLNQRSDYKAIQQKTEAAKILKESASLNTLNSLDLSFNIGYSGLVKSNNFEELFTMLFPEKRGFNYSIGITYELPFQNKLRTGILLERQSQYDIAIIRENDLKRKILSEVSESLSNLKLLKLELVNAQNSVKLFKEAFDNEKFRQEKGLSTFFDVDQTEQKLTNAQINLINTKINFLKAIVDFKYQSGVLVKSSNTGNYNIDIENIFELKN